MCEFYAMRLPSETEPLDVTHIFPGCGVFSYTAGTSNVETCQELTSVLGGSGEITSRGDLVDCIHHDDRAAFEIFLEADRTNSDWPENEFRVSRSDGTMGVVNIRLRQDDSAKDRQLIKGMVIDVTRSRLLQRRSQELGAASASSIGHYHHDYRKARSWWSTAAYRLFDLTPSTSPEPYEAARNRIHKDDREAVGRMIEASARRQGSFEMSFRVVKPDGSFRWVLDRGESFGPLDPETGCVREARGVLVDVTDQILSGHLSRTPEQSRQAAIENVPFGVIQVDADLRIVQLSEGAEQTLAGNGQLIGSHIGDILHEMWNDEFAAASVAHYRHTLETGEPYRSSLTTEKRRDNEADESYDWTLERVEMPDGRHGVVCHFYNLTEQAMVANTLRDNAKELREILDSAVAFIGVLDPDGTLTEANQPALTAGGLSREDVIGKKFWQAWWWDYDVDIVERLKQSILRARAGEVIRYDAEVRMAGGVLISIDFMLAPIKDVTGEVIRIVASGFDITERKKSEAHIRLLMGEINHRSKNVLSLVQSIARLSGGREHGGFLQGFEGRLQALAASYDLLLEDRSAGVGLHDLITAQLAHVSDETHSRVVLKGPPLNITAEAAQGLGMAIHELATNAAKYGALSGDAGRVEVIWQHRAASDGGFEIRWCEGGGPPVVAPASKGFGSTVLGPMAEKALQGEVTLAYNPGGLMWMATCGRDCLVT
jgi:PAS domain S-box-containing protein